MIAIGVGVLLRFARLNEVEVNTAPLGPVSNGLADVLRAVVETNDLGEAAPFDRLAERPDQARGRH